MISDIRFAFRSLLKSPGFTALAVLSLALAIGVNSGIFALVRGVMLKPMVDNNPQEVVRVFNRTKDSSRNFRAFSHAEFAALSAPNETFSEVGAFAFMMTGVEISDKVRRSMSFVASDGYFRIYGVSPIIGRTFTGDESRAGSGQLVTVLSYTSWQRLGGKQDILGKPIRINGTLFTVVGVMPEGFSGGNAIIGPELWLPLGAFDRVQPADVPEAKPRTLSDPSTYALSLIGRMKPGLTIASAQARLETLSARFNALRTDSKTVERALEMHTLSRFNLSDGPSSNGPIGILATLLLAMAGIVLAVACLNLANMTLARSAARSREFAVRLAVGAPRYVIVRLLLIEGMMLSLAGGAIGLWISYWGNALMISSFAEKLSALQISIVLDVRPDFQVFAITFLLCTAATLLFSLAPGLRAARVDVVSDLKQGSGNGTSNRSLSSLLGMRQLLIMAQLALSLGLVFAASLFFRAALAAKDMATGFEARSGLVAEFDHSLTKANPAERLRSALSALEVASAQPGCTSAALSNLVPFTGTSLDTRATAPDGAQDGKGQPLSVNSLFTAVSSGYFKTIGVSLLRGRDFSTAEAQDPGAKNVVIIDESLSRRLFPKEDALGRRIRLSEPEPDGTYPELVIVGIVTAFRNDIFTQDDMPRVFVPFARGFIDPVFRRTNFGSTAFIHQKIDRSDRAALIVASKNLGSALRRADSGFPLISIRLFEDIVEGDIGFWLSRLGAILFGIFGSIALLLAVIGVYGVKSYAVARRTREIGIRVAVGAQQRDILRLVMGQGAVQIAIGLGFGLVLSLLVGQVLSSILIHINAFDPLCLLAATGVLTLTSGIATWIPAQRAARVDPIQALRAE